MWTRILLAAIPLLGADAIAQTQSERGRPAVQPQRVQPANVRAQAPRTKSQAPRPTNLGGVKSQAPRPIKQLGGTKVPFQRPIGLGGTRQQVGFQRSGPTSRTIGDGPRPGPVYRPIDDQYNKSIFELPSAPRDVDRPRTRRDPGDVFRDRVDDFRRGRGDRRHDGRPIIFHDPRIGVITSGSGLTVNGSFEDDNFRLRFHLGSPFILDDYRHGRRRHDHHHPHHGNVFAFPAWGYYGGTYYDWNAYDTVYGSYAAYDPSLYYAPIQPQVPSPVTIPTTPATDLERADALLAAGVPEQAIAAYKAHLNDNPGDAYAMRGLGLALIADAQFQDGVAMVAMAYKTDPALAADPIPAELFGTSAALRTMVERVSIFSNRSRLPSAWLTLAALMQAEGRTQLAVRMIERARQAGLEAGLAQQMQAALGS